MLTYNPSPPRMFLSLDLLSKYRIQHGAIGPLYVTSSYSTWDILQGSFRFCNWLSLRRLVPWINHLPLACWSTFWKSIFKYQLGSRFDILDSISSFFCILTYAIIYVLIHHIIFWLYLYFLNILYFFKYSCTNIFHRRSLCTSYENGSWWKGLNNTPRMISNNQEPFVTRIQKPVFFIKYYNFYFWSWEKKSICDSFLTPRVVYHSI